MDLLELIKHAKSVSQAWYLANGDISTDTHQVENIVSQAICLHDICLVMVHRLIQYNLVDMNELGKI